MLRKNLNSLCYQAVNVGERPDSGERFSLSKQFKFGWGEVNKIAELLHSIASRNAFRRINGCGKLLEYSNTGVPEDLYFMQIHIEIWVQ